MRERGEWALWWFATLSHRSFGVWNKELSSNFMGKKKLLTCHRFELKSSSPFKQVINRAPCEEWIMHNVLILMRGHAMQVHIPLDEARRVPLWWRDWPTTWMWMSALSDVFSIWTDIVYFPEWRLSAERMKMMVSTLVFRIPTVLSSRRTPSLYQVTTGRGFPWD